MKITVVGAGYVGLTTAAMFASSGYTVTLIESHFNDRLETIKSGRSWFYEEGLDAIVADGISSGNLIPNDNYDSLKDTDMIVCCMGTPDNPDGSSNLTFVFNVVDKVVELMPETAIFVQKSTVPVGTGDKIKKQFEKAGKEFTYVSNPEFLRESTAVADTLWFDRIVVGSDNKKAAEAVLDVYRQLSASRDRLATLAKLTPPKNAASLPGEYIATAQNSAELIKVSANAFLALKISFANSIAKLADATKADIMEVMDAIGADPRIGRAFLNAGRGYGGGCFPKDVSGLISSANAAGIDIGIMKEVSELNMSMPGYIANKVEQHLAGSLEGKNIAVLGLAFKAGTSDARKSPAVKLANILVKFGCNVTGYDPKAGEEAAHELDEAVKIADSIETCIKDAEVVCVATDWPEFLNYDLGKLKEQMSGSLFVDCMNRFDIAAVEAAGFDYIGVGRRGSNNK